MLESKYLYFYMMILSYTFKSQVIKKKDRKEGREKGREGGRKKEGLEREVRRLLLFKGQH